jgi:hypothetical protein
MPVILKNTIAILNSINTSKRMFGAGTVHRPNNELNGSPVGLGPTFPVLGCHNFCGKWGRMQEQKSRQHCGRKSSFSSNALGESHNFFLGAKGMMKLNWKKTCPRFTCYLERKEGHTILWMPKSNWDKAVVNSTNLVSLDIEDTPMARVADKVEILAVTAYKKSSNEAQVDIYRNDSADDPTPVNKDTYRVIENMLERPDYIDLVSSASTSDSDALRTFISEHVLLIKEETPSDHWLSKLPKNVSVLLGKST